MKCIVDRCLHRPLIAAFQHFPQPLTREEGVVLAQREQTQVWIQDDCEEVQVALDAGVLPSHLEALVHDRADDIIEAYGVAIDEI